MTAVARRFDIWAGSFCECTILKPCFSRNGARYAPLSAAAVLLAMSTSGDSFFPSAVCSDFFEQAPSTTIATTKSVQRLMESTSRIGGVCGLNSARIVPNRGGPVKATERGERAARLAGYRHGDRLRPAVFVEHVHDVAEKLFGLAHQMIGVVGIAPEEVDHGLRIGVVEAEVRHNPLVGRTEASQQAVAV